MSLRRVYEMQYLLISIPPKEFWELYVYHMTEISNKKLSDVTPPYLRTHMIIESVDEETKTMKQRFAISEFFEGYKMNTVTTKVTDEASGLNSLVEFSVEYDKSGPEIKDLEAVEFLPGYIREFGLRFGRRSPVRLR